MSDSNPDVIIVKGQGQLSVYASYGLTVQMVDDDQTKESRMPGKCYDTLKGTIDTTSVTEYRVKNMIREIEQKIFTGYWHLDDLYEDLEEGNELSQEDAEKILVMLKNNYNYEVGMSREYIQSIVIDYFQNHKTNG